MFEFEPIVEYAAVSQVPDRSRGYRWVAQCGGGKLVLPVVNDVGLVEGLYKIERQIDLAYVKVIRFIAREAGPGWIERLVDSKACRDLPRASIN